MILARLGKTGRAATAYLVLAGLQRGVSLLILPFITHAMTPAEYGAASILTASALLMVAIIAAPVEQLVFRASARGDEDAPALLRVIGIYCYFVIPAFAAISALPVALFLPSLFGISGTTWAIEILAVGFLPAATSFALPSVRARQDLRKFAWLASASVLFTASSKLIFIVVLNLGVFGWAISDLVGAILSAIMAQSLIRLPRVQCTGSHVRTVLSFCVPLIPHRASFWALLSLSRPAMATVTTLSQVGLLSFGLNLASVANLVISEIHQAVLPRYSKEQFPAPTAQTRTPARIQLLVAFAAPAVVGAAISIAGKWIFAESYWPSFALTGVLLCGQAAWGLYLIPMNYLVQAAGKPKFSAVASISGALVIMIGIFAFGAEFGALGAAYATAVGFIVMAVAALILTRIFRLSIHWGAWIGCWPETVLGIVGLVLSVLSLSMTPGSQLSYGLALTTIVIIFASVAIASRRQISPRDEKLG